MATHTPTDSGIRRAELMAALSLATDLGIGQPLEHALRTCVVATRLGEALGLTRPQLLDVYYLALLRAIGCTAESDLASRLFGDEIATGVWMAPVEKVPAPMIGAVSEG